VFTYAQYIFGGSELNIYVSNIINISIFLIVDKIRRRSIYKRLEAPLPEDEKERKTLAKKDVGSVKTSLYLFYIFALVASHTLALDTSVKKYTKVPDSPTQDTPTLVSRIHIFLSTISVNVDKNRPSAL